MTTARLDGVRVAVLRVEADRDGVAAALAARGASASSVAVATIDDRGDIEVHDAVGELARFAWVAVTSANAARRLSLWSDRWPAATKVAAVGPATAASVAALGLAVHAVAPTGTASSLATRIDTGPVLFLAAATARTDLAAALGSDGVEVTTVVAYDVVGRTLDDADAAVLRHTDVVVAMSPIAFDALDGLDAEDRAVLEAVPLVAIGPTTAARAARTGWGVTEVAADRGHAAVCDAVARAVGR